MAIKGKTKAKSKPRSVARAPRAVPVEVKPPFFLRRWVQVSLAFVAGLGVMVVLIWATNGVRDQNRTKEQTRSRESARRVVQEWQTTVDSALSTFGPAQAGGAPPTLFPDLSAAIDATSNGKPPQDLEQVAKDAGDLARTTSDTLDGVELSSLIADKGLRAEEAIWVLDSQKRMAFAFKLYGQVAGIMGEAAKATDAEQVQLAKRASSIAQLAVDAFQDGYENYTNALASVGLFTGGTPAGG